MIMVIGMQAVHRVKSWNYQTDSSVSVQSTTSGKILLSFIVNIKEIKNPIITHCSEFVAAVAAFKNTPCPISRLSMASYATTCVSRVRFNLPHPNTTTWPPARKDTKIVLKTFQRILVPP